MGKKIETIFSYTKSIKLLYIEDNEQARTFTLELLSRFFDNITVAIDGENGLNCFKEENIDLIMTDVNMPKMSGIEMSILIREVDSNIPIILLSAHNEKEFLDAARSVNVDEYLEKPLNLAHLMDILEKLAISNRAQDAQENLNEK